MDASRRSPVPADMRAALWTVTIVSGVTSALGIYLMIPRESYAPFLAAMAGLAITMLLTASWTYLYQHTRDRLRLLLGLVFFLPVIAVVSTWSNATALAGPAAVRMHLKQFVAAYNAPVNEAQRRGERNARIVAAVAAEAAAFQADVAGEVKEGRLTGAPGRGAVTITLERVADQLDAMTQQVEQAAEQNAQAITTATDAFAALQVLAEQERPATGDVKAATERLRMAIIRIDEVSPANVVAALLPGVEGVMNSLLRPEGEGFAARQRAAIEDHIRPRLESIRDNLAELAKSTQGSTAGMPGYEPITPPEAAVGYYRHFPVQWSISAALDLAPLVFLVLLLLGPRAAPVTRSPQRDLAATTDLEV